MQQTIANKINIGPQEGPQSDFISSRADIVIYGGAAGGGKSYGLLLDPLRHYRNQKFGGVIFRKNAVQVRNEGGLWDQSMGLYPLLGARPREDRLEWKFPTGMSMSFANLEHENSVFNYQGSQIPWMGFDELTHFSETQFFYMYSRNRSTSGVKPRIRGTCNPDPDSWVRKFIDWWIGPDGFPIKERASKLRYFIRVNDEMIWANTAVEIYLKYGESEDIQPKSVTFIPAKLQDNQILMREDPSYRANLLALSRVDRMRLLEGNWNIRATAGNFFRREWFEVIDTLPAGNKRSVRYWDRAATPVNPQNSDPDWTRGALIHRYPSGYFVVGDLKSIRDTPLKVETLIQNTASQDGKLVQVWGEQEPGSSGVADAQRFKRMLAGFIVRTAKPTNDKATRAKPFSAQCEAGNVKVLRGSWNEDFFRELENFSEIDSRENKTHDDIVDAASGAFNALCSTPSILEAM